MTSLSSPAPAPTEDSSMAPARIQNLWRRFESFLEGFADRLNPILVKEARQALKSRQFALTFTILLAAGWIWSFFGLATIAPRVALYPTGPQMLTGYVYILAFAMLIIVPFSAFRSLAIEREDGTYELLSITTLTASQIVSGKLGSSILQMFVYLSAMSPFIAFTYLLRGVDVVMISLLLFYALALSIALSVIGLLLATLAETKMLQTLLSVMFIAGVLFIYFRVMDFAYGIYYRNPGLGVEDPRFWFAQLMVVSIAACLGTLCFLATAAQITFASENRSTKLRVMMLIESAVFIGWILFLWAYRQSGNKFQMSADDPAFFCLTVIGIHWAILGAMMTGESPEMSRRVQRRLPVSSLGRAFLTWFHPGPSTGYFFAIANMAATVLFLLLVSALTKGTERSFEFRDIRVARFGFLLTCYLAIFLGIGRLLMLTFRRYRSNAGIFLSVVIQVMLIFLGAMVPFILQTSLDPAGGSKYSSMHISNVFWTLAEVADGASGRGPMGISGVLIWPVQIIVGGTALLVFVLNLFVARKHLALFRSATPHRVQADDIEQRPELAPRASKRQSPWD